MLRYENGLSFDEIGTVLGVPEVTARSHVHRARKELARLLTASGWAPTSRVVTCNGNLRPAPRKPDRAMNEAMGSYRRWRAAEASERDDDADSAFQSVFQSVVPEQPISPEFTTRTMTAVAAAAAVDARRARQARAAVLSGAIAATVAAVYVGGGWAIGFISAAFIGLLNLLVAAVVADGRGLPDRRRGLGRAVEPRPGRVGRCRGPDRDLRA